jgi:hypothetical protein
MFIGFVRTLPKTLSLSLVSIWLHLNVPLLLAFYGQMAACVVRRTNLD